jgi:hypothetical protein
MRAKSKNWKIIYKIKTKINNNTTIKIKLQLNKQRTSKF